MGIKTAYRLEGLKNGLSFIYFLGLCLVTSLFISQSNQIICIHPLSYILLTVIGFSWFFLKTGTFFHPVSFPLYLSSITLLFLFLIIYICRLSLFFSLDLLPLYLFLRLSPSLSLVVLLCRVHRYHYVHLYCNPFSMQVHPDAQGESLEAGEPRPVLLRLLCPRPAGRQRAPQRPRSGRIKDFCTDFNGFFL